MATVEDLQALAKEYEDAPEDASWEYPHPIFMMAEEIDTLTQQRDELLSMLKEVEESDMEMTEKAQIRMLAEMREIISRIEGETVSVPPKTTEPNEQNKV
jgi:hypothetical protein